MEQIEDLAKTELIGATVAYKVPNVHDTLYGSVISIDDNYLRITSCAASPGDNLTFQHVQRRIDEESTVILSLQTRLSKLKRRCDEERNQERTSTSLLQSTLLEWAKKRLRTISKEEWASLGKLQHPSESARLVCSATAAIKLRCSSAVTWHTVRSALSAPDLPNILCGLDESPISSELYHSILDHYAGHRLFSYDQASKDSRLMGALQKWVTAYLDYQRARYFGNNEEELVHQIHSCKNGIHKAWDRRKSLQNELISFCNEKISKGPCEVRVVPLCRLLHVFPCAESPLKNAKLPGERIGHSFLSVSSIPTKQTQCVPTSVVTIDSICDAVSSLQYCAHPADHGFTAESCCAPLHTESRHESCISDVPPTMASSKPTLLPSGDAVHNAEVHLTRIDQTDFSIQKSENERLIKELEKLRESSESRSREGDLALRRLKSENFSLRQLIEHHSSDLRYVLETMEKTFAAQKALIADHTDLQLRYERLVQQATVLLQLAVDSSDEVSLLRQYLSMSQREVLLCKAVVAMLRAASREHVPAAQQGGICDDKAIKPGCEPPSLTEELKSAN